MKKYLVITGGAGFVGSNLIESLIKKTNYKILSLDNYSSGTKKNHVNSKRVKYLSGETKDISKILKKYKKNIETIFHFGEFARIYQSFQKFNQCYNSNIVGSNEVFNFCIQNNIRIIYSATSASLGNDGKDKNLSPYAFTKSHNLETIFNLNKWYGLNYEIIYFYNVYGPKQITKGNMATVIGIFEYQKKNNLPLSVVRPGNQKRRFTHIDDTISVCIKAWKERKQKQYIISSKSEYSIKSVAKMFKSKIIFLPKRAGERYSSSIVKYKYNKKIIVSYGKKSLKNYIKNFLNT